MPKFQVTAPDGQMFELEGDSAPTEQELEEVFAQMGGAPDRSFGEEALGALETGATMGSAVLAEPLAGLAGLATASGLDIANKLGADFDTSGIATDVIEGTREALTYSPRTEAGQEDLQDVGEFLAPVGEAFTWAEDKLGNATYEATGSPTLAAAAATVPTLATEILGIAAGKGAIKLTNKASKARESGQIARSIENALPTQKQLKDVSRGLFKEIDETGAVLRKKPYERLVRKLESIGDEMGIDSDITPKAAKALQRFQDLEGQNVKLSDLEILRRVAQNAASSLDGPEKALGVSFIDEIDDMINSTRPQSFVKGGTAEIGKKYALARDLWGRARRSEMLEEAFDKARLQASGFENGIRTQFRAILNNKKRKRFFNADEIKAMEKVVQGGKGENLARLLGRLSPSEGSAHNMLSSGLGAGAGYAVAGGPGALAVPAIGWVSRKVAAKLTANNARMADDVIRAGRDAKKITKAYLKHTPKAERNANDLSQLLMRQDIDLNVLKGDDMLERAAQLAREKRAARAGVATATASAGARKEAENAVIRLPVPEM